MQGKCLLDVMLAGMQMHGGHSEGAGCMLWLEVAELAHQLYINNKSKNVHSLAMSLLVLCRVFRIVLSKCGRAARSCSRTNNWHR